MRLIHITDPHLSSLAGQSFWNLEGKRRSGYLSWYKKRQYVHRREILDLLTTSAAACEPDLVLLTGDLVHIGLEAEMIEAAAWLRQLGPPEKVLFVPGNHDNYARDSMQSMYRHWADYLPGNFPPGGDYTTGYPLVREHKGLKLVGVNTSCVTRIFSAAGELGEPQRNRLGAVLEKNSSDDSFDCLLIHHPPFPGMTRRRKALRDAAELRAMVGKNSPDLVLYGHIHCNREDQHGTVRSFCTASGSSIENASFRIIDLEKKPSGWHCRVRLMTLDRTTQPYTFSLASESSWQR